MKHSTTFKYVSVIALVILLFFGLKFTAQAGSVTVQSKGKANATKEGKRITWGCDNSDEVVCKITINFSQE